MKKILSLLIILVFMLILSSCNYQCYEINSWRDYDGEQIQVEIKDYGKVVLSSYNSVLIVDKCPYCDLKK